MTPGTPNVRKPVVVGLACFAALSRTTPSLSRTTPSALVLGTAAALGAKPSLNCERRSLRIFVTLSKPV